MSLERISYDVPSQEVLRALDAWNLAYLEVERCKTRAFMARRARKHLTSQHLKERADAERSYAEKAAELHRALSRVR